jgi:membrane fusion protein, multidrug efflux system
MDQSGRRDAVKTLIARIARMRRAQALAAAVLSLSAVIAVAAHHGKRSAETPLPLVLALPVHPYADLQAGDPRYPVEAAARYSNAMSFRVAGKLIERKVRLGATVHQGEAVASLDPIDAQKQVAGARAALDAAEHRLVFAKQQLDRDSAQSAQNLISAAQLEQTQDAYSAALAGREQAADNLVVARDTLQYHTLVADHDGVITSENADTGQVVAAGQAVYGLAWSGEVDVVLDATASDVATLTIGERALVTFPALPEQRFDACVREISPSADPQSRTYRVKLTLDDPAHRVRLGMTGDAAVAPSVAAAADAHTFKVPATALFHRGRGPAVWVIRAPDSTLELRAVTVRSYGERSVVITGGLADGDNVVQAGVHTVYAGERVKAVRPLFDGENDQELNADADPYAPTSVKARAKS